MSLDGTRIAIAATGNDEGVNNAGRIFVYDYDGNGWILNDDFGYEEGDSPGWSIFFGSDLEMSGDGSTIISGGPHYGINLSLIHI